MYSLELNCLVPSKMNQQSGISFGIQKRWAFGIQKRWAKGRWEIEIRSATGKSGKGDEEGEMRGRRGRCRQGEEATEETAGR